MHDADFQADLSQLANQLHAAATGPEHKPVHAHAHSHVDVAAETRARQEKLKETVRTLQESLDHLRLSVKYLVFDLEATRRENEYLRKLLDASRD